MENYNLKPEQIAFDEADLLKGDNVVNERVDIERLKMICPDNPGFIQAIFNMLAVMEHFNSVVDLDKVMNTEIRLKFSELQEVALKLQEQANGLEESVKLQNHYALLLNERDGGERIIFSNAEAWLIRLKETNK